MIGSYTAPKEHGILVVFSGPSGAGKGTILKRYFEDDPPAVLSVSATTRAPRPRRSGRRALPLHFPGRI